MYELILKYAGNLKRMAARKKGDSFSLCKEENLKVKAMTLFLRTEQRLYYPEVIRFFENHKVSSKIPSIVLQMNLFMDTDSLIRVKCKFRNDVCCPLLLPTNSHASVLVVRDIHQKNMHFVLYCTLRELRKNFWLPKGFSTVSAILKQCITCRRLNERPLKLNQSSYRDFRTDPPEFRFPAYFWTM